MFWQSVDHLSVFAECWIVGDVRMSEQAKRETNRQRRSTSKKLLVSSYWADAKLQQGHCDKWAVFVYLENVGMLYIMVWAMIAKLHLRFVFHGSFSRLGRSWLEWHDILPLGLIQLTSHNYIIQLLFLSFNIKMEYFIRFRFENRYTVLVS